MESQTQQPDAGPGHNRPPETEENLDALKARTLTLVETANRWAKERPELKSDEEARKAKDFKSQLHAQIGEIEAERTRVKRPWLDGAAAVDARYNPLKRPVELAKELVAKLETVWLEKKQKILDEQRRQAEAKARAEREAAEKAAREAAAEQASIEAKVAAEEAAEKAKQAEKDAARQAKTRAQIASDYGHRATSLRSRTVIEIEDPTKIPARVLKKLCDKPYVRDALVRAVRENVEAYSTETEDGGLSSKVPGVIVRKEKYAA